MNKEGRTVEIRCGAKRGACRKLLATIDVGTLDVDAPGQADFVQNPDGTWSGGAYPKPVCPKHGQRSSVDLLGLFFTDVGELPDVVLA